MIYVFGHKSPDTDSTVSAIAVAHLLAAKGIEAAPFTQGAISPETEFVLSKFGLKTPEHISEVTGKEVAIVDTTEPGQLPADIGDASVKYIFDHHNLGGLKTKAPFEGWILPAGCTCTIIKAWADGEGIAIPAGIAGAMTCAIISDTVMFKSPTTTEMDRKAVAALEKIAGIKSAEVGMEMLRVKSSIEDATPGMLIARDLKEFDIRGHKIAIAQIELIDIHMIDAKLADTREALEKLKATKGYWGVLFIITDIMQEGSILVSFTDDDAKIESVFGLKFEDHQAWFPGLMSRKKQIVPPLEEKL